MSNKRTIFLHIQKTAGTSAVVHLKKVLKPRKMLRHGQFSAVPAASLWDYDFIAGHFGFEYISDIIDSSYSFTFLREPVQRVLSLYSYCQDLNDVGMTKFPIFESARRMSIDEFVRCEDPESGIPASIDNTQTWQLAKAYTAIERLMSPPPADQQLYELAVRNLAKFSHVGFQEDFLLHLRCILLELGFRSPENTCHINVSPQPLSVDALQPQSLSILRERLRLDLALYEHARNEYGLAKPAAQAFTSGIRPRLPD